MSIAPTILIVEDDSDFRQFLVKLLSLKDYETLTAGNAYEALHCLNDHTVDLVLLDIRLPDIDGYWVMDRIKAKFPNLLVIMMTGSASVDSAVKALRKGTYDYLEKPFPTEKLLKTIQNAFEHKRSEVQRKQALGKLGESEEKYHQLFDSVTDALFIIDAETLKFEDANKAALNLFGYSIEELCNHKVHDLSAEKEKTRTSLGKVRKGGQGSRFIPHRLLQKKDGTKFYGEISVASFNSGGQQKIIAAVRDITERQHAQEELKKAKERLQHLLASSPAVIYTADPASEFAATFVSDNIKKQLGYEPKEYMDDPKFWVDRLHPDDAKIMMSWVSNLMETGSQVSEYRFRHKDGSYRWLYDQLMMIYDEQGVPKEVIGSSIDITAQKDVENKLRESEERYRQLFENESNAVFVFDLESLQIEEANGAALKLFGYSKKEILNLSIIDISAEKNKALKSIQTAKETKTKVDRIPLRYFRRKDGSVFPGDVSVGTFCSGGGLKGISSIRDITHQFQAEKKLRESEERFRNLVENSPIGIAIIQDHKFVYQNRVQDKLYGPISGKSIYQTLKFIHPDDMKKIKTAYERVLCGNVQTAEEDFRFFPSGKIEQKTDMRWARCRATPFFYQGENALLVNSIDITDAKQLEHQLIVKNKMLSLGRVAAGIAHEIRNPLTGINSYLFTLEDLCQSETFESSDIEMMKQIVEQLQVASNKIESVIKRVMDFSKPGAPKLVLTDLNQSIEEAIKLSLVTLRKSAIKLEKSLGHELPRCYIDPQLIEQVILNFITNAARAMEKGNGNKLIEVDSFSKNNMLCISVSDSGPGVPFELREKIFDPFFTTREDGQGIGLNIAQRIIADHNGSLSLDTGRLGGAEFRIELPLEKRMEPR
jgi:PAS domain S-box-containing protein